MLCSTLSTFATALAVAVASLLSLMPPGLAGAPLGAPAQGKLSKEILRNNKEVKKKERVRSVGHDWIKGRALVRAPISTVWYSVHEQRKRDPDLAYSKVLEQSGNESTLEQKFVLLPIFGSSVCVLKNVETPLERIDYRLLRSDHFKAMEGSWILTPSSDGKSTMLELISHIDLGLPIPHCIVNATIAKKIERRLNNIKEMAEGMHADVAGQCLLH